MNERFLMPFHRGGIGKQPEETQMGFKIGDKVTWKSQAQGYRKEKTGIVVEVVEKDNRPSRKFEDLYRGSGCGFGRDHESYVIEVHAGKTIHAKPKHYWPRTAALKPA